MDEFTDFEKIDLEELSGVVIESFCDRYIEDAARILNTGIFLPNDGDMIKMSLSIVMALYYKRIGETIKSGDRVRH